jgi:DNA repair protein RadD
VTCRELRLPQTVSLQALRVSIASGHRRPILCLPTGAGKTRIAAEIMKGALAKGKRVGFVVPRLSLIPQALSSFAAEDIPAGVLQGQHPATDSTQPVQIISAATLARRQYPEIDLLIVDEAHVLSKAVLRWMRDRPDVIVIGLSATPWSRGLGRYFDDLIIGATISELIEKERFADSACSRQVSPTSLTSELLLAISRKPALQKPATNRRSSGTSS